MLERIDYIEKNGKAVIYRCYGEGSMAELPQRLRGLSVAELADHCFAREASARYKKYQIQTIRRAEWEGEAGGYSAAPGDRGDLAPDWPEGGEYPPLCGEALREIWLPEGLEATGDYAFYGCLNLETLHFPASMRRLGGGSFVACNKIKNLIFTVSAQEETPYCLKDVIGEVTFETEVLLDNAEGKPLVHLTYPEYYEESVENTPARIIEINFHGTGYRYRQCFQGRSLDYGQYDSLFELARAQEFLPTVLRMALYRLQTPVGLTESRRENYLEFLRQEGESAARWIFEGERLDFLYLLGEQGYFTEELLELFMKAASTAGAAEAVSYLMDYRRTHFRPAQKKKYMF